LLLLAVPGLVLYHRSALLSAPADGRLRPVRLAYLAGLVLAALVTIVLTGYWGLVGTFLT
jgi:hypothetical protein